MTNRKTCQNIMPDSFPIFAPNPISLVGGVPECCSNNMLAVAKKKKKTAFRHYNINPSTKENYWCLDQS